jgi:PAS domain-containing protein
MLKLTVVSGPNRGASFPLTAGETSIGRQMGNVIVLPSNRVSKKHCALEVEGDRISVKDLGSSNGTFVNGVLTKGRELRAGDRISIGEFVFELVRPGARPSASSGSGGGLPVLNPVGGMGGNIIPFPGAGFPSGQTQGFGHAGLGLGASGVPTGPSPSMAPPEPQNLKERLRYIFDHRIMPAMYGMLRKNEWRMVGGIFLVAFIAVSVLFVVQPLTERSDFLVRKELTKRARFMSKLLVERNGPLVATGARNRTDVSVVDSEPGIRAAYLLDIDGNIIAPISRANQSFNSGVEALFVREALEKFKNGREEGISRELEGQVVAAIEPIKVGNPRTLKNETIAIALVSADASLAVPGFSDASVDYLETFLYLGALGVMIGFIYYRVTLKPFEVLNDDIDLVLKGEIPEVTHEYKLSELDSLWEVINSALQRIPKSRGADGGSAVGSGAGGNSVDEYAGPMRMLLGFAPFGMVILDEGRRVIAMNGMFEELSGIRFQNSEGQELAGLGRDQSFGLFVNDLCDRAPAGGEGVNDSTDFSGIPHRVYVAAFGATGNAPRCYIFCALKAEG